MYRLTADDAIFGRYRGEVAERGILLAERIRQAIGATPFVLPNGESITITASIGVSGVLPDPDDEDLKTLGDSLIARADVALYRAKSGGRDQVAVDGDR